MPKKNLTQLLKKLHSGEPMTNDELIEIQSSASSILDAISGQGDFFYPITVGLRTDLDTVNGYLISRGISLPA